MLCASLGRKHTENTGTTPDIQNSLIFEEMTIVDDRCPVGACSNRVLQHLLVDTCITTDQPKNVLDLRCGYEFTEMRVRIGIAEIQK